MKVDLFVTKNIVRSIAPSFNGDGRLAAVAFERIWTVVSKFKDEEVKTLAGDIVFEMGGQFKGNLDRACETFERLYATIAQAKRSQHGAASSHA